MGRQIEFETSLSERDVLFPIIPPQVNGATLEDVLETEGNWVMNVSNYSAPSEWGDKSLSFQTVLGEEGFQLFRPK
jgi:hypothetical protein